MHSFNLLFLSRQCRAGDEISGLSVSIRERDDLIQIWNTDSRLADQSKAMQFVKNLLAGVQFYTVFYTGKCVGFFVKAYDRFR
jgi:hypothetical protein